VTLFPLSDGGVRLVAVTTCAVLNGGGYHLLPALSWSLLSSTRCVHRSATSDSSATAADRCDRRGLSFFAAFNLHYSVSAICPPPHQHALAAEATYKLLRSMPAVISGGCSNK
jgi:hypothetical protein